jgi:hypothetical protein
MIQYFRGSIIRFPVHTFGKSRRHAIDKRSMAFLLFSIGSRPTVGWFGQPMRHVPKVCLSFYITIQIDVPNIVNVGSLVPLKEIEEEEHKKEKKTGGKEHRGAWIFHPLL